jgi:secreted trypsin-like serine protease
VRGAAVAFALLTASLFVGGAGALPRVLGGSNVAPGALPFVVAVTYQTSNSSYLCTGTVIAPNAVLTANHCGYDEDTSQQVPASAYTIYTKTTRLDTPDPGAEQKSVASVHTFAPLDQSATGDVAVLMLSTPTTVPPVRLATAADNSLYAEKASAVVAGWGASSYGDPYGKQLVQGDEALKATWECTRNRSFVPAVALCAAPPGTRGSLCNGDSGGPLLASTASGWVEIGVTSETGGLFCGTGNDYFARVATLQPWIASEIAGTTPPKLAPPPLQAPVKVTLRRTRKSLVVTFPNPAADPATLLEAFSIYVKDASGRIVRSRRDTYLRSVTFTLPPSGTYRAAVTANYTAGKSAATVSPPVTIPA